MFAGKQSNNKVDGDLVGRDKIENNYIGGSSTIVELNAKYQQETPDAQCSEFLETLQHYMQRAVDPDVRGLAAKLQDADRSDLIHWAEQLKERITKKVMRYQTSPAAQDIFAYVMQDLHSRFQLEVRPAIQAGADRPSIDALISDRVITPVLQSLAGNVLKLYAVELLALVFFLGGNCHIRWDKC